MIIGYFCHTTHKYVISFLLVKQKDYNYSRIFFTTAKVASSTSWPRRMGMAWAQCFSFHSHRNSLEEVNWFRHIKWTNGFLILEHNRWSNFCMCAHDGFNYTIYMLSSNIATLRILSFDRYLHYIFYIKKYDRTEDFFLYDAGHTCVHVVWTKVDKICVCS